eukprot:735758_1
MVMSFFSLSLQTKSYLAIAAIIITFTNYIFIISIYDVVYGPVEYVRFSKDVESRYASNKPYTFTISKQHRMEMRKLTKLMSIWYSLFECIALHNNPGLDCTLQLNITVDQSLSNLHNHLDQNIWHYSYHRMLSLRRQIMIINDHLKDKIQIICA